jgi:hypothetical protein
MTALTRATPPLTLKERLDRLARLRAAIISRWAASAHRGAAPIMANGGFARFPGTADEALD